MNYGGAPRLDAAVCRAKCPDQFTHRNGGPAKLANTVPGFKKLICWLKKQGAHTTNSFLGMEHTGHYTLALCCFLQQAELPYTMISPLELKRSMGLARGKNDRVDAMTVRRCGIAQFEKEMQSTDRSTRCATAWSCFTETIAVIRSPIAPTASAKCSPPTTRSGPCTTSVHPLTSLCRLLL